MDDVESLGAFIARIASEEYLPLPKQVPDNAWEDEDAEWDDFETKENAEKRIWSGKVAEILFRDFENFLEERAGPASVRAEGTAPGIPWWFAYSEESLSFQRGDCVLCWQRGKRAERRYFARHLSPEECDAFVRLRWPKGLRFLADRRD